MTQAKRILRLGCSNGMLGESGNLVMLGVKNCSYSNSDNMCVSGPEGVILVDLSIQLRRLFRVLWDDSLILSSWDLTSKAASLK